MDKDQQISIFKNVSYYINDLNELLDYENQINIEKLASNLNEYTIQLDTKNLTKYLASLMVYVFFLKKEEIFIPIDNEDKIIVMNYINNILEELKYEPIIYRVV